MIDAGIRTITKVLQIAALVAVTAPVAPRSASAACICTCVSGTARNICTNAFDIQPICSKICPVSVAPPGAPQNNPDLESLASSSGKTGPNDKFFVDGKSQ
ncbi:hypothetical protein [Methylobacterium gnaphalii]|uniref:Uncharacterized protein n=1 Tax=Methylobacterium gnaphalii TaxID=1010610 RepID=A0A512JJY4_9HYPH|nr:hypothetical protein [Methylobacterium gnaphalii]GEP10182.1 hypothetical protein MGN01_20270 [Methylobacterium gnaphalii]GJD70227.1 hypothetical protein MMMDOFMJ_3171 [Methylobacterium gnaphalii]GLS48698.1 hypothetical protein GCM10007885_15420 [Methylobacterium gnaphalii]